MKEPPILHDCPKCGSPESETKFEKRKYWFVCKQCGFESKKFACLNDAKVAWNNGVSND